MKDIRSFAKWKIAGPTILSGAVVLCAVMVYDSFKVVVRTDLPVAAHHADVLVAKR